MLNHNDLGYLFGLGTHSYQESGGYGLDIVTSGRPIRHRCREDCLERTSIVTRDDLFETLLETHLEKLLETRLETRLESLLDMRLDMRLEKLLDRDASRDAS